MSEVVLAAIAWIPLAMGAASVVGLIAWGLRPDNYDPKETA